MSENLRVPPRGSKGDKCQAAGREFQVAKEGWLLALAACPTLSGADYAVAIVILKHLNSKSLTAWPALATIAELSNRQVSTVWRSIKRLVRLGFLIEEKAKRGRYKHNVYRPTFGNFDEEAHPIRVRKRSTSNWKNSDCETEKLTSEENQKEPQIGNPT
jgi:predicted transcriptional regulator